MALDIPVDSLASAADNPAASGNLADSPVASVLDNPAASGNLADSPVASVLDNPAVARNPVATAAWQRGAGAAADFVAGRAAADS